METLGNCLLPTVFIVTLITFLLCGFDSGDKGYKLSCIAYQLTCFDLLMNIVMLCCSVLIDSNTILLVIHCQDLIFIITF